MSVLPHATLLLVRTSMVSNIILFVNFILGDKNYFFKNSSNLVLKDVIPGAFTTPEGKKLQGFFILLVNQLYVTCEFMCSNFQLWLRIFMFSLNIKKHLKLVPSWPLELYGFQSVHLLHVSILFVRLVAPAACI